ncbi:MAG: hypothetical protein M0R49_00095 [Limnochordia bacterium]|nr:hypothetical protein [Limnochordia bacterium]
MAKTEKVYSKKELTEAFKEMADVMVLEEGGKAVQPSGDFEKLKAQIAEAAGIIAEDDEFSEATADVIEWVLDNLEAAPAGSPEKPEKEADAEKAGKPKKKKVKKEGAPGMGVIATIAKTIEDAGKDGISKEGILQALVEAFPERDSSKMKKTINVQVPARITKERFAVEKTDSGTYRKK